MGEALAPDAAEVEFNRFVKLWDIDPDTGAMSADDKSTFESQKSRVIKELCRGHAVLDEDGRFIYKIQYPKKDGALTELIFDITRGNKAVMDGFKDREMMKKTAAYIGSLTGQPVQTFLNLDPRDQKFAEALIVLFLAS
jgi:hypothetical protein